jgi:hypothetical protein
MDLADGQWRGIAYAVRLAEDRGAVRILIEPRVKDELIVGWVSPDVYAERTNNIPLFIEVEDSTGAKFVKDGPRHRAAVLIGKAEFVFVLGPGAKGKCEKKLREYYGQSIEIIYLSDLISKYGELEVRAVNIAGRGQA